MKNMHISSYFSFFFQLLRHGKGRHKLGQQEQMIYESYLIYERVVRRSATAKCLMTGADAFPYPQSGCHFKVH